MKKTLSKILSVMLAVISVITMVSVARPAKAYDFSDQMTEDYRYNYSYDGKLRILEYLKDEEIVTIPNEIDGIPVSKIEKGAFINKKARKVIFSENVREMNRETFVDCPNLEEVVFNDGFESMTRKSFSNCPSIKTVHLPKSCYKFTNDSFHKCDGIEKFIIEKSLSPSSKASFSKFSMSDKTVFMLKEWPSIDIYCYLANGGYFYSGKENEYYIFKSKEAKKEYSSGYFTYTLDEDNNAEITGYTGAADASLLDIPAELDSHKVVSIGAKAFESKVESRYKSVSKDDIGKYTSKYSFLAVKFPSTLKRIGDLAFTGCTSLESVSIPDSVEYIGYGAFALCTSLANPVLPASLKTLCGQAFAFCPFDGELKLPNGIEYIGTEAFARANSNSISDEMGRISSVEFPKSLKFIGVKAFAYNSIESIKIPKTLKSWDGAMAYCRTLKNVEFEDGWTSIAAQAFDNCKSLESITLPDSIKRIEREAFNDCLELKEVIVSENSNIEFVGNRAFAYTKITNADFAQRAELGNGAFRKTMVTSFAFTKNQKIIPGYLFTDCKNLSEISFEDGVITIGPGAFENTAVKNVVMPDSIVDFGGSTFEFCKELETVVIPKNTEYIREWAFADCEKLYKVTWNRIGNKEILYEAFRYCTSLKDFTFEDITCIDEGAFDETGITDVKLTLSNLDAQTVGESSFQYFSQLKTLEVGGNVKEIRTLAFASCENLETAVIADSVEKIADDAFDGCEKLTIYCNENSYAESYAKANRIRVTTLIVAPIANQSYTGKKIEPQVSVRFSDRKLTDNKEYSTEYINNLNVGTANVIVTGLGDFSMLITKVDFAIIAVSIDKAEIASIPTQTVNGQTSCEPKLKIKFNGKTLREGEDYTVSYKNNKSAGTATAIIKGIGNFKGTASVDFNIEVKQSFKDKLQVAFNAVKAVFVKAINWFLKLFK